MIRKLTLATVLTAAIAFPAMAQDVKAPAMGTPATATNAAPAQKAGVLSLTSQEAQAWIGKPVYSSDGTKLGEVATFQRASDNKVTGMFADIGGYLGLGEHRIMCKHPAKTAVLAGSRSRRSQAALFATAGVHPACQFHGSSSSRRWAG